MRTFLQELDRKLKLLNKSERRRYCAQYKELIQDKTDQGIPEKEAISQMGEGRHMADEILSSYEEQDLLKNFRNINKRCVILDMLSALLSAGIAFAFCYAMGFLRVIKLGNVRISYLCFVATAMLCISALNFLAGLYTVKLLRSPLPAAARVFIVSVVAVMMFFTFASSMILRIFICIFVVLYMVVDLAARRLYRQT